MKKTEQPDERVFVAPGRFTLLHRAARRARIEVQAAPDFVLVFVLEGALRLDVEARHAEQGGLGDADGERATILLAPGESAVAAGAGVEYVQLTVAPAVVLDCAVRARLTRTDALITFRSRTVAPDERLLRIARDAADELREESAGRELMLASLVEQSLVHVLRRHASVQRSADLELSRAGLVDRRIRRAVELMHTHIASDLPLEELAAAAYLSPFHFARLFKKLTGATPHSYLAALRAARAQALLAETDLSITEVAARVGYSSSSHFSKAFRRATGLTPRAFRNALVRP
jgi:AraC family transcriptional regulator